MSGAAAVRFAGELQLARQTLHPPILEHGVQQAGARVLGVLALVVAQGKPAVVVAVAAARGRQRRRRPRAADDAEPPREHLDLVLGQRRVSLAVLIDEVIHRRRVHGHGTVGAYARDRRCVVLFFLFLFFFFLFFFWNVVLVVVVVVFTFAEGPKELPSCSRIRCGSRWSCRGLLLLLLLLLLHLPRAEEPQQVSHGILVVIFGVQRLYVDGAFGILGHVAHDPATSFLTGVHVADFWHTSWIVGMRVESK